MSEAQSSRAPAMSGPEPSRAAEAPVRKRTWVILGCIPEVVDKEDKFLPGTDMLLEFEDPPRTTIITVPKRIAPGRVDLFPGDCSFPYVVDVHPSGRLLLRTTRGQFSDVYYLCDAHTRVATRLPDPDSAEKRIAPRRSIGLIADPRSHGHYMVAQLHPTSSTQHATLVYYSTETNAWAVKELGSSPQHQPWGSHGGVVTHDGKLWWVDLPYGMLTCDPFLDRPDVRYVALPEGRVMADVTIRARADLDKHRCVKASEGKLRYVEIHGVPGEQRVSMWTLADPEGPVWEHEYEVLLEEIWDDESYTAAGLPPQKVPAIALIHPKNHGILYFFQGAQLFAVNMCASKRRVLECENSYLELYERYDVFHNARFVHAWELPPTLLPFDPSSENAREGTEKATPGGSVEVRLRGRKERKLRTILSDASCFFPTPPPPQRAPPSVGRSFKGNLQFMPAETREFVSPPVPQLSVPTQIAYNPMDDGLNTGLETVKQKRDNLVGTEEASPAKLKKLSREMNFLHSVKKKLM